MAVIVYRKLTLTLAWFQGRRILCDACDKPFTYLAHGEAEGKDLGLPVLSSSSRMALRALPEALHQLVAKAREPRRGLGLCPHCRRYQRFMVANVRGRRGIHGLVWGPVLGIIVGAIVSSNLDLAIAGRIGAGAGLAVAVGVLLAFALSGPKRGPHPDRASPESRTDDEVDGLLTHRRVCEGADPVLLWAHEARPKQLAAVAYPVGLGFADFTGDESRFGTFSTEKVLRPIEEQGLGYRQRDEE